MYYHASPTEGITTLEPRVSHHGIPLIYFSKKRENVLVYLSNAIDKYCRETGFVYEGKCATWGPYGFDKEGRLQIQEYYPNALEKAYKGVSAYIYSVEGFPASDFELKIPDAAVSEVPVPVAGMEIVPDAYEAILQAEKEGLISILRYEDMSESMMEWNVRTIRQQYEDAVDHPEYRHFLQGNFADILNGEENAK